MRSSIAATKAPPHPEAKVLSWAEGDDIFLLRLEQIRALQEKTGYGPFHLMQRLIDRIAWVDEWRETIRLGLIGAGMESVDAMRKVQRSVDRRPMAESIPLAIAILEAAMLGPDHDPVVGKASAGEAETGSTSEVESPSPQSSEQAPS